MTRIDFRGLMTAHQAGTDLTEIEPIRAAFESLTKDGYAVLDHVVAPDKIAVLRREFESRYRRYFQDNELEDTLEVGNRRYMVPVELAGPFADPDIYANAAVVAVARHALDITAVLESFGAVISLSDAKQQHIHRDGPVLFDSAISAMLPAHALTFVLPLIDMNEEHGTTALWPGSHRWRKRDESVPPIAPEVPAGSCLMWDFRLYHGGTPNRSTAPRPILYSTYARRWYQDPRNFEKPTQRRLVYDQAFVRSVPEPHRPLFDHLLDRTWNTDGTGRTWTS